MAGTKPPNLVSVIIIILGVGWANFFNPVRAQDGCLSHPLPPDVVEKMVAAADATLSLYERDPCFINADQNTITDENGHPQNKIDVNLNVLKDIVIAGNIETQNKIDAILTLQQETKDELRELKEHFTAKFQRSHDCSELHQNGKNESGVYTIYPYGANGKGVRAYCEMSDEEQGWTVILSRRPVEHQVNFNRSWNDYKAGFGDPETEYWIGNEVLHQLTRSQPHILRVDMEDWDGNQRYALYDTFSVEGEKNNYKLHVGGYSGNAGDALRIQNNMEFSTPDRDNDGWASTHCALVYGAGFWYNACSLASPTHRFLSKQKNAGGICWRAWYIEYTTLMKMVFKIKPPIISRG